MQYRETVVALFVLLVLSVYTAIVLATGLVPIADFLKLYGLYLSGAFSMWMFVGVVVVSFKFFRAPNGGLQLPASPFRELWKLTKGPWSSDRVLRSALPPFMFGTLMASFNAYKQMVLSTQSFSWDKTYIAWDRALLFGNDGWQVTHAVFAHPIFTYIIDKFYHAWFFPMALGVIFCAWVGKEQFHLRTQYMLTYLMVWIGLGSVAAFLVPGAGPAFVPHVLPSESASFAQMLATLQAKQLAVGKPISALLFQDGLWNLQLAKDLAVGGGISAMPSVHNAIAILFALAAWRINPKFGVVMAGYAVLIWIGSIHLGWHYAVDGLIAAILTLGLWNAAGHLAKLLDSWSTYRIRYQIAA